MTNHSKGLNFLVDLDAEEGKKPRGSKKNEHRVKIVKASNERVRLHSVSSWLSGQSAFDNSVLEAISENPSGNEF